MQNKARVCLACSPVVNSYRTHQRVSLLPETDAASTNPTLIFHVLTLDFLIFGGGGWWGWTIKSPRLPSFGCIFFFVQCWGLGLWLTVCWHPPPVLAPAHLCCDVPAGAVNTRPLFLCSVFPLAETNHFGAERWTLWPNGPLHLSLFSSRGRHPLWQAAGVMPAWLLRSLLSMFSWLSCLNTICTLSAGNDGEGFLIRLVVHFVFVFFQGGGPRRLRNLPRVCAVTVYFDPWFRRRHC